MEILNKLNTNIKIYLYLSLPNDIFVNINSVKNN